MTRLGLLVKPEYRSAWRKWLLGLPGMNLRFVFYHPPSGKSVEVWVWFSRGRWINRHCRKLGINLLGCGDLNFQPVPENGFLVNRGNAVLVNSLLDLWRTAMQNKGISPARARVVLSGDNGIGVLCAQALAEETACLTLTGKLCSVLGPLLHRALYETGVLIKLERDPLRAGEGADAIILAGTDEELPLGEQFRSAWIYRLAGTSPLMVRLPGKVTNTSGVVPGIISKLISKALPGWVRGWKGGIPEDGYVTLPADYCEALLLALEGGSVGCRHGQVDRLEYLHQVKHLGIDYQLTTVQLDFP